METQCLVIAENLLKGMIFIYRYREFNKYTQNVESINRYILKKLKCGP